MRNKPKKWGGDKSFIFLPIGNTVETVEFEQLIKFYDVKHISGNIYEIVGYKDGLIYGVFDKCYGIFVNIYQNFMIDKYLFFRNNEMNAINNGIARIISKSCFSIGVIDLANLFKQRNDQVYNLNTLELLLKEKHQELRFRLIHDEFKQIKPVVMKLRDQFYAHRDFNVVTESDKGPIWEFNCNLKEYFREIVDQIGVIPKNYNTYLEIGDNNIKSFLNQNIL